MAHGSTAAEAVDWNPMLALLLAREEVRMLEIPETVSPLHSSLAALHERTILLDHEGIVDTPVISP